MKKICISFFLFCLNVNSFANGVIKCLDENKKIIYSTYQDIAKSKQKLKCENAKLGELSVYSKGEINQDKKLVTRASNMNFNDKETTKEIDSIQTIESAIAMTNDPDEKKILEELKQSHFQNNLKNKTDVNLIVSPDIKDLKSKLPISIPK